jgi:glyoxylase-like metal-dependent hydrolase (beta-lactamase superfamily II)
MLATLSRRDFLGHSASCASHLALAAAAAPAWLAARWARSPLGEVVAREPFGTLERVGDGVWALVSTPLGGDRTTVANGGIVAGRTAVVAVEGFFEPRGAAWLAARARELTGRWPTHVVLTHYHADHANGVAGYRLERVAPELRATAATRALVLEKNAPADAARADALRDAVLLAPTEPTLLDLGGRQLRLVPRRGHTASDLTVEVSDPHVLFCGDLVWNGMFPNYVDAEPSTLAASVAALRGGRHARRTVYVPGHGALARQPDLDRYVSVLAAVEQAARRAHAQGLTPAEAAARFALPAALGEWTLFNKLFYERAFVAWGRELGD